MSESLSLKSIGNSVYDLLTDSLNVINNFLRSSNNIISTLDNVTFDSNSDLTLMFGTFRYVLGDALYIGLTTFVILGVSFVLYKLFKHVVNFILGFIPTVNIRIP